MGFGEALLGVQLATALHKAGDEVLFLAPAGLAHVVRAAPVRYGRIDLALSQLDAAVLDTARSEGCASIVLIDLVAVYTFFGVYGRSFAAFLRSGIPVVALDVWNVPEAGLAWDYHPETFAMGPEILDAVHRLVPVPFVRPTVPAGYNALPPPQPWSAADRQAERSSLGIGPDERLIFWPSAAWQHASQQLHPARQRMAAALPPLIVHYLKCLSQTAGSPPIRVVHVGPEPFAAASALGDRYVHLTQQPAARFARILAASDLLLSFNVAATTVMAALSAQVPVLIGTHSARPGDLPPASEMTDAVRTFCAAAGDVYPFRAWPLSLSRLLAPVLHENPLLDAVRLVGVLDESAMLSALRELISDGGAETQRARQERYVAQVQALPGPVAQFRTVLARAQDRA